VGLKPTPQEKPLFQVPSILDPFVQRVAPTTLITPPSPQIHKTASHIIPDTLNMMSWELSNTGA
jgi:hypothetical protein